MGGSRAGRRAPGCAKGSTRLADGRSNQLSKRGRTVGQCQRKHRIPLRLGSLAPGARWNRGLAVVRAGALASSGLAAVWLRVRGSFLAQTEPRVRQLRCILSVAVARLRDDCGDRQLDVCRRRAPAMPRSRCGPQSIEDKDEAQKHPQCDGENRHGAILLRGADGGGASAHDIRTALQGRRSRNGCHAGRRRAARRRPLRPCQR
jgi:hypothetical protein